MTIGLVGRKCGMTRRFSLTPARDCPRDGRRGVAESHFAGQNRPKTDGYRARTGDSGGAPPVPGAQSSRRTFRQGKTSPPATPPREFRLNKDEGESLAAGGELKSRYVRGSDRWSPSPAPR